MLLAASTHSYSHNLCLALEPICLCVCVTWFACSEFSLPDQWCWTRQALCSQVGEITLLYLYSLAHKQAPQLWGAMHFHAAESFALVAKKSAQAKRVEREKEALGSKSFCCLHFYCERAGSVQNCSPKPTTALTKVRLVHKQSSLSS